MLGWELCYARREAELIVSNDPAMFSAAGETVATPAAGVNEWTLVRLDARAQTLDPVARRLEPTCWQTEPCAPDAAPPTDILTNLSGLLRACSRKPSQSLTVAMASFLRSPNVSARFRNAPRNCGSRKAARAFWSNVSGDRCISVRSTALGRNGRGLHAT
jgi:hypothetical protein